MGDWDYINEHMGGHDADGLPNFMSAPGFADDCHCDQEEAVYCETFKEAQAWAKKNHGKTIVRSPDGKGLIKNKGLASTT